MEVLMTREVIVRSHAAPVANLLAFALGAARVQNPRFGSMGEKKG
jgi:hypothetical protein